VTNGGTRACWGVLAVLTAAGLHCADGPPARAQSVLPLRGAVDDGEAPPVPGTPWSATTLAVQPLEARPLPRGRAPDSDPYAARGIGSPVLKFYPALTTGAVYTSNVKQSPSKADSDVGVELRPTLRVESDWVRHSISADVSGDIVYYTGTGSATTRSLDAAARLRLDVRRHTTALADASYTIEDSTTDPREDTLSGAIGVSQDFGAVIATLRAGVAHRAYGDTSVDNSDLDYVEPLLSARASLNVSAVLRPYLEISYARRFHDTVPDRNGYDRDSQGYGIAAGMEIDAGPIWSGDVGLTYLHRNYDDAALDPASALGLVGNLAWSPSELTRVVMTAATAIDEISDASRAGKPVYSFGVAATHGLRDNIDVSAGAALEIEDYGSYADRTYEANVGVSWKLNPGLSWTAGYDLKWLDSGMAGGDYVEHRVSTGVTIRP
jgi:hypothetical protein